MHQVVIIEDLAVVLCVASLVIVLFQKIKQPVVLGYLLAGLIVGPYTPPFSFIEDEAEIRILAELGVIFLMFSLGLEFDFKKLLRVGFAAVIVGFIEVVLMVIVGYFVSIFFGWSDTESFLVGAALAISSTTIIVKALNDLNLKHNFFAELTVGILLVEDLIAVLLMVFITTALTHQTVAPADILATGGQLLLVIASWFLIGYFIIPYGMKVIQKHINNETLTILSSGLCLFLSSLAVYFNYSAALGAFIMGSILAESPQSHKIEELTQPIRDIFVAVFFVSVGMLIDPALILKYLPIVLILTAVTILGKVVILTFGSLLSGQTFSNSMRVGFSMAQIGEFSFIIIGIGGTVQVINEAIYPVIVAIATITTFTTPYLIMFSEKYSESIAQALPKSIQRTLDNYRKFIQHSKDSLDKKLVKDIVRFIINGIIVAIICSITTNFLAPKYLDSLGNTWAMQVVIWGGTLIVASPFIWAMLFSETNKHFKSTFSRALVWGLTLLELVGFSLMYLNSPWFLLPIFGIMFIFFRVSHAALRQFYLFLERQFVRGLNRNK